jgi:hypothetical protein
VQWGHRRSRSRRHAGGSSRGCHKVCPRIRRGRGIARLYGPSGVFMGDVAPEAVATSGAARRAVSE